MTPEELRGWLLGTRAQAVRTMQMLDGALAALDEEAPDPVQQEGCQHARAVEVGTLGNPGGKLCLDCDQAVT